MPALKKIGAACLAAFGWTTGAGAVTASYLIVAGGGGASNSGGGGAGGYLTGTTSLNTTLSYTVVVGAGGSSAGTPANGSNSSITGLTAAVGGGYGGAAGGNVGGNGGSGGGGGQANNTTQYAGGSATAGQGNNGGYGYFQGGGGGGGAGAVGGNGTNPSGTGFGGVGGNGGAGLASSISGTSTYYAGGGGGSGYNTAAGTGGTGGGGNGSVSGNGTSGTANTGGGAGASLNTAGNGGSGIVIISYAGAQQFGGGIVTSVGGNTIHTFTTSGTLSPLNSLSASYLIVAGGGGGGGGIYHGGGGGAGGMLTGSGVTIDTNSTYLVTVGAGGAGGVSYAVGANGSNSSIGIVSTASVGGGGGGVSLNGLNGISPSSGGSGGGAYGVSNPGATVPVNGGAGTSGQGNAGGNVTLYILNSQYGAAGGGGAGAVGGSENTSTGAPGAGGIGATSSISGTSTYYAGGGGGSVYTGIAGGSPGAGGLGGGGAGGSDVANATSGTANTGGGGGGMERYSSATGGSGGSGIVIISYAGSTQQMAGGSVTITGGNVIHTFTSSGYLTPLTYYSNSLRFRSSNSAYLNRTPTVASNRKTWTWSAWVKRGTISTTNRKMFGVFNGNNDNQLFEISFYNDKLYIEGYSLYWRISTAVYRDPAAWYHIVVAVDTTQSTANDRIKLFVNGVQVTAFDTTNNPSQNSDLAINQAAAHYIGSRNGTSDYFDGYQSNINFIDGQALTPNSFGAFNSYGVWQPINYGGSYGTNGFYLPFSNTASTTTLGYDFSPQGNNWTCNNISLTAGSTYDSMTDVPTLTSTTAANYATLNPLLPAFADTSGFSITNGNLSASGTGGLATATIGVSSGKFYFEVYPTGANASSGFVGIWQPPFTYSANSYSSSNTNYRYYGSNGNVYNTAGSIVASYATWTAGDVVGVALDMDNGTLKFYKNNTLQGTAATGLSGTWFLSYLVFGSSAASVNFGQQPFTYTPPSGYVALNTYNM